MNDRSSSVFRQLLVSSVIAAVLGFQAIAAFDLTPGPIEDAPFLWPFLSYPMYSSAHYEGETIPRYRVFGTTEDGREVEITPETLGARFFIFHRAFVQPFLYVTWRGELDSGVELFEEQNEVRLVRLRLENRPLALTAEGTSDLPVRVEATARRDGAGDGWTFQSP